MLRGTIASAAVLFSASILPHPACAQDIAVPQEWSTHFAWFLVANPEYSPVSKSADSAVTAAHIQYQLRLQRDGKAIVAGGLGAGPGEHIIGLTILRAGSRAEAQAVADADPAVRAGRFVAWVREWWVPTERLP